MKRHNLQGQVVGLETEKLHLENEIERLNNIINLMNDYLVMKIANGSLDFMYRQGFKDSYERLQELKGSESNAS